MSLLDAYEVRSNTAFSAVRIYRVRKGGRSVAVLHRGGNYTRRQPTCKLGMPGTYQGAESRKWQSSVDTPSHLYASPGSQTALESKVARCVGRGVLVELTEGTLARFRASDQAMSLLQFHNPQSRRSGLLEATLPGPNAWPTPRSSLPTRLRVVIKNLVLAVLPLRLLVVGFMV